MAAEQSPREAQSCEPQIGASPAFLRCTESFEIGEMVHAKDVAELREIGIDQGVRGRISAIIGDSLEVVWEGEGDEQGRTTNTPIRWLSKDTRIGAPPEGLPEIDASSSPRSAEQRSHWRTVRTARMLARDPNRRPHIHFSFSADDEGPLLDCYQSADSSGYRPTCRLAEQGEHWFEAWLAQLDDARYAAVLFTDKYRRKVVESYDKLGTNAPLIREANAIIKRHESNNVNLYIIDTKRIQACHVGQNLSQRAPGLGQVSVWKQFIEEQQGRPRNPPPERPVPANTALAKKTCCSPAAVLRVMSLLVGILAVAIALGPSTTVASCKDVIEVARDAWARTVQTEHSSSHRCIGSSVSQGHCGFHLSARVDRGQPWCRTSRLGSCKYCDVRFVELRRANNGDLYNSKDFQQHYGDLRKWNDAEKYVEKRMAADKLPYTLHEFYDYYADRPNEAVVLEKWNYAAPETRKASDGHWCTWDEFTRKYGHTNAWHKWDQAAGA